MTSSYLDPLTGLLFLVGMASALWLVPQGRFVAFLTVGLAWLLFFRRSRRMIATFPRRRGCSSMLPVLLPIAIRVSRAFRLSRATRGSARAASEGSAGRRWRRPRTEHCSVAPSSASGGATITSCSIPWSCAWRDGWRRFRARAGICSCSRRRRARVPGFRWSSTPIPCVDPTSSKSQLPAALCLPPTGRASPTRRALFSFRRGSLPRERQSLEQQIAEAGKAPCSVRTSTGEERFKLWTAPGTPDLCSD